MHIPPRRRMAVASLIACAVFAQTAPAPPARTHGPEETGQTTQPVAPPAAVTDQRPTQSTEAAPIELEAASVKTAQSDSAAARIQGMRGGPGSGDPGLFRCTNCTLRPLLLRAYDLRPYDLVGPPSIDGDQYDIAAKIPPGTTKEDFNLMLQDLLVKRFGLATHKETRIMPIYELVVAKGGSKLKEAEKPPASQPPPALPERPANGGTKMALAYDKDGNPELPPGKPGMIFFGTTPGSRASGFSARMMTIDVLLGGLGPRFGRPVVNKTGLTGTYDFKLLYAPEQAQIVAVGPPPAPELPSGQGGLLDAASDPAPNLLAAFERQLGLKFEDKKGPVQVLVVDKVNRTPTEN